MKILMIGPDSQAKGGVATVINNFRTLDKKNDVFFLSSWKEKKKRLTGIKVFFQMIRKIKKEKIDIVHFHVAQKGSFYRKALLATSAKKNAKVIFHMHASQFDTFYSSANPVVKKYIRNTLDQLDGIVVLSEEWARFYTYLTDTPITIIENAVLFPSEICYNLQSNKIITFGKVGVRKGSYDILAIAKKIECLFPGIVFVLYGDGEIEKVKKIIFEKQIKNVELGGWIEKNEKIIVMKDALLHFLPSYQEGLPMSILETMSYGIPNLSTNVGGIPQVINGKNSLMVDPGDIEAMIEKISFFIEHEEFRSNASKEARITIQQKFSINNYFDKWNEFYKTYM